MVLDVAGIILGRWQDYHSLRTGNLAILKGDMDEKCTNIARTIYETTPISFA